MLGYAIRACEEIILHRWIRLRNDRQAVHACPAHIRGVRAARSRWRAVRCPCAESKPVAIRRVRRLTRARDRRKMLVTIEEKTVRRKMIEHAIQDDPHPALLGVLG